MPQPNKIPRPFAASGDKNTIPESSGALGFASWQEGFPAITGMPFAQGGVAPKRADFNGIFNALSAAVVWAQQGGVYAYDIMTDYEIGNVAEYNGDIYVCVSANGPGSSVVSPTDATTWKRLILTEATQINSGYMSAADKKIVDSVPGLGTFNKMFFSQTSGNYIAPRTGVYRITLKGGGGGGGYYHNSTTVIGGGGGEGGEITFYKTLQEGLSYPFAIGAGGTAPANTENESGGTGGATSFNNEYSVTGGTGGRYAASTKYAGGPGGWDFTAPTGAEVLRNPGQSGEPGGTRDTYALGGGCSPNNGGIARYGGGGRGGGQGSIGASAGATGYILIEYAG